jgi:hypothetical protein
MKRVIRLGIGGLVALVVGLVLPYVPDTALHAWGASTFQGAARFCRGADRYLAEIREPSPILPHILGSCATARNVMDLGPWLVILGAVTVVAVAGVLILGWIRLIDPGAHAV